MRQTFYHTTLAMTRAFGFCSLGKSTASTNWMLPCTTTYKFKARYSHKERTNMALKKSEVAEVCILGIAKVWWYTSATYYVKMQHNYVSMLLIYCNISNIII